MCWLHVITLSVQIAHSAIGPHFAGLFHSMSLIGRRWTDSAQTMLYTILIPTVISACSRPPTSVTTARGGCRFASFFRGWRDRARARFRTLFLAGRQFSQAHKAGCEVSVRLMAGLLGAFCKVEASLRGDESRCLTRRQAQTCLSAGSAIFILCSPSALRGQLCLQHTICTDVFTRF